jgi:hypothetical protein
MYYFSGHPVLRGNNILGCPITVFTWMNERIQPLTRAKEKSPPSMAGDEDVPAHLRVYAARDILGDQRSLKKKISVAGV